MSSCPTAALPPDRREVTALHLIERALGVPMKRLDRPMLGYLSRPEIVAVLGQPGSAWTSQRDHLLLTLLYNTGARVTTLPHSGVDSRTSANGEQKRARCGFGAAGSSLKRLNLKQKKQCWRRGYICPFSARHRGM
jgi:hypothetical protein